MPMYLRRVYLDVIGTLPTPEEARRFLADRRARPPCPAGRRAARPAGVCRLLGVEVVGPAPGRPREAGAQAGVRLLPLAPRPGRVERAARPVRARRRDGGRTARRGRARPTSSRWCRNRARPPVRWRRCFSASGSPAPSATITPTTAGARTTTTACRRSSPPWRSSRVRGAKPCWPRARRSPRTPGRGCRCVPRPLGQRRPVAIAAGTDPRTALADWLVAAEQPVLRAQPGQPLLGPLPGPGAGRAGGRRPRHEPAVQPRAARRAGRDCWSRAASTPRRLIRAITASATYQRSSRAERDQRRRRAERLAGAAAAGRGRGAARHGLPGDRRAREVRGRAGGRPGDPALGQQGRRTTSSACSAARCGSRPASASGTPSRASARCSTCSTPRACTRS